MKVYFVILQKAHVLKISGSKKLSPSQIAVFFDHQNLCKESNDILVIFHGVNPQAKAASAKVVVWSDVASFTSHAIRLHVSLTINILRGNQLLS